MVFIFFIHGIYLLLFLFFLSAVTEQNASTKNSKKSKLPAPGNKQNISENSFL